MKTTKEEKSVSVDVKLVGTIIVSALIGGLFLCFNYLLLSAITMELLVKCCLLWWGLSVVCIGISSIWKYKNFWIILIVLVFEGVFLITFVINAT